MKKAMLYRTGLMLIILAILGVAASLPFLARNDDPRLADADYNYRRGEAAKTIADRKQAFNASLQLYQSLEREYHPRFGSGRLYYNIGNAYFQLEEYPWAILNYLRAQALMPRNEKVLSNLALAQEKLTIDKDGPTYPFSKLFFFHNYLSLPERLQVFFLLSIATFGLMSAVIWYPNPWIKRVMWFCAILAGIFLLSLIYTQYFSPVRAVLVQSSDLYRDAGMQYAKVGEVPLSAGTQVEVIDTAQNGKWLKIITPKNDPGFVPQEAIRIL